jgi:membrane protein
VFAYFRAPVSWTTLLRRTVAEIVDDDCAGLAAQLAFYFLLAVFPALLVIVALLGYLPIDASLETLLLRLEGVVPEAVLRLVREQMDQVLAGDRGGLLTVGMAGALWSSSAAMTAIIDALNRAFDIEEWRPWWKRRLVAIALTAALAVFVVTALGLVLGGLELAGWIATRAGFGAAFEVAWALVQWPLVFLLVVFAIDLVYHYAPNADTRWVWITPGSLLAAGSWLLVSLGFRWYVQNVSDYTALYGAVGAVIVSLTWLYLTGFVLLAGAELDAEIDHAMPTRDRGPQGPHRRRKIGAAAEEARQRPEVHAEHAARA